MQGSKTGPVELSPGLGLSRAENRILTEYLPVLAKYNSKQKVSLFDSKPVCPQGQARSALSSPLPMPLCSLGIPTQKPEFLV